MSDNYFWHSEAELARLEPLLPTDTGGVPRFDDRRVIRSIVHVFKSGNRWADAPAVYGPHLTLYNRFVRWAAKAGCTHIFHALASAGGPPAEVLIDSSAVKAHRCASGGKGGAQSGDTRGGRSTKIHALTDTFCRPIALPTAPPPTPCWNRCSRRRSSTVTRAMTATRHPLENRSQGHGTQHPAEIQSALEALLLARPLPRPQRHRAYDRQDPGLPKDRDPIRQVGTKLPRRRLSRRHRLLLVMSPEPSPRFVRAQAVNLRLLADTGMASYRYTS